MLTPDATIQLFSKLISAYLLDTLSIHQNTFQSSIIITMKVVPLIIYRPNRNYTITPQEIQYKIRKMKIGSFAPIVLRKNHFEISVICVTPEKIRLLIPNFRNETIYFHPELEKAKLF